MGIEKLKRLATPYCIQLVINLLRGGSSIM